ncbi:MAG: MaoC family dehydratase [Rhodoferax sp.]
MKAVEITETPGFGAGPPQAKTAPSGGSAVREATSVEAIGLAATFFRALGTGSKRPGLITALPKVELALPRVLLDAQHIARYRQLCGFNDAQGVPLIYPQLLTFPLVTAYVISPACPWPALGTVHLANAITQQRALSAGDEVRVELASGDLFSHDKGQVFTLKLRILRGGELVWSATQSLLRVGVQQTFGTPYTSQIGSDAALSCQAEFSAGADIGRRYGAVSGDRNPIHMSVLTARLFGFKRAIAHGMWTSARALSCLLPSEPLEQAALAVEFKTPLLLPGRASLWSTRSSRGALFEVRDPTGQRPHLRGQLSC